MHVLLVTRCIIIQHHNLVCVQIELNLGCFKICYRQSFDGRAAWMCDVAADSSAPSEFKQASMQLSTSPR